MKCPECDGKGFDTCCGIEVECSACDGSGFAWRCSWCGEDIVPSGSAVKGNVICGDLQRRYHDYCKVISDEVVI